jgi:hypothetical protein
MEAPQKVDYPTDEDSDENNGFMIKIPDLSDLMNEFERDDDVLYKSSEGLRQLKNEFKLKGYEYDPRDDIKDQKKDKSKHLDANIST